MDNDTQTHEKKQGPTSGVRGLCLTASISHREQRGTFVVKFSKRKLTPRKKRA
jgi:hypothetical protein